MNMVWILEEASSLELLEPYKYVFIIYTRG